MRYAMRVLALSAVLGCAPNSTVPTSPALWTQVWSDENIALNGQGQLMIVARTAPAGLTCYYGACRYTSAKVTTVADDFHTFSVEWDSLTIRYLVDDTLHYVVGRSQVEHYGNWVFDQPFFVILNLAVGGHFDGDPQSHAIFPATMLVDYVRVYRRAPPGVH